MRLLIFLSSSLHTNGRLNRASSKKPYNFLFPSIDSNEHNLTHFFLLVRMEKLRRKKELGVWITTIAINGKSRDFLKHFIEV